MKNRLFRRSIALSWIVSYVLILGLSLIGMLLMLTMGNRVIKERITQLNIMTLQEIKNSFDSIFSDVQNTAVQIAFSQNLDNVVYEDSLVTSDDHYNLFILQNEIRKYSLTNENCGDIFMYLERSGYVLTQSSVYDSLISGTMLETDAGIPAEAWNRLIHDPSFKGFQQYTQTNGKQNLIYKLSIPLLQNKKSGEIFIIPNRSRLSAIQRNYNKGQESIALIVGNDGTVIFSENKSAPDELPYAELSKTEDTTVIDVSRTKYVATSLKSDIIPGRYLILVPYNNVFAPLNRFVLFAGISLTGIILIGFVLSYAFAMHNYSPIRELVAEISGNFKVEAKGNEFVIIDKAIQNAEISRRVAEKSTAVCQKAQIIQLLRYERNVSEQEAEWISAEKYVVLLLKSEDEEVGNLDNKDKRKLVHLMLSEMLERIVKPRLNCYVVEIDSMIAVLVRCEESVREEDLLVIARDIQHELAKESGIRISASLSQIHSKNDFLSDCYKEAFQAMEYRIFFGKSSFIPYSSLKIGEFHYQYPLDMEQNLIYTIQTGDLQGAREHLNAIYSQNFSQDSISVHLVRCLMFDLLGTMIKALEGVPVDNELLTSLNPVKRLIQCDTLPEITVEIDKMLVEICNYINERKMKSDEILIRNIQNYIKENYGQEDLNVAAIADRFKISQAYFTKTFKKVIGKNPLEYLTLLRIENAKQILISTNHSIGEVAQNVGYISANTFIRIFKRYTGITPGSYRELYGNSDLSS